MSFQIHYLIDVSCRASSLITWVLSESKLVADCIVSLKTIKSLVGMRRYKAGSGTAPMQCLCDIQNHRALKLGCLPLSQQLLKLYYRWRHLLKKYLKGNFLIHGLTYLTFTAKFLFWWKHLMSVYSLRWGYDFQNNIST